MASPVKQSSTQLALKFYMVSSTDHISAATGLTPTVTIRKEGGTFASPAGAVTEIANGWYQVAGNATDTNTLGEIVLHATATGADPFDGVVACVVAYDPQSALATPTNITGGTITTVTNLTNLPSIPANWITATGITAGALNGKGDWNIGKTGYSLTQTFPTNFSALAITAGGAVTAGTISDKTGYALTSGERTSVADAILDRDMSAGTDSGSPTVRTVRQALRALRNKWSIASGTYTVTKEDDATASWTATVTTDGTAQPITGNDPA